MNIIYKKLKYRIKRLQEDKYNVLYFKFNVYISKPVYFLLKRFSCDNKITNVDIWHLDNRLGINTVIGLLDSFHRIK